MSLVTLNLISLVMMFMYYYEKPHLQEYTRMHRYADNSLGQFLTWGSVSLVELVVVILILRPHSFTDQWKRVLAIIMIFLPYAGFFLIGSMHSSSIFGMHSLWHLTLLTASSLLFTGLTIKKYLLVKKLGT